MVEIAWDDFEKVDVRVGRVVAAEPFPEARKPSIKLSIDFGPEVGEKRTSAQLTTHYDVESLLGKMVVAVVNFPPKRIAGFKSEVLVLGVPDEAGEVVLLSPDLEVPTGGRMSSALPLPCAGRAATPRGLWGSGRLRQPCTRPCTGSSPRSGR